MGSEDIRSSLTPNVTQIIRSVSEVKREHPKEDREEKQEQSGSERESDQVELSEEGAAQQVPQEENSGTDESPDLPEPSATIDIVVR